MCNANKKLRQIVQYVHAVTHIRAAAATGVCEMQLRNSLITFVLQMFAKEQIWKENVHLPSSSSST
jgi:hypothetical protein